MKRHVPILRRQILNGHFTEPDNDEWRYAVEKLFRLEDLIFEITVNRTGELITLSGNVASEQVKCLFGEILSDYDPAALVSNELEVIAPSRSAEDHDLVAEKEGDLTVDAAAPAPIVSVERYPSFSSDGKPVLGQKFRFEVDLSATPFDHQAMKFDLPSEQVLAVDVDVYSAQLRMHEGMKRRKIVLFDDGRSMAARFEGEVIDATAESTIEVLVFFAFNGRYSGMTRTAFKFEETGRPGTNRCTDGRRFR